MKTPKNHNYIGYPSEEFVKGGIYFIHTHGGKEIRNGWRKIGNRYLANCSWCGKRVELK